MASREVPIGRGSSLCFILLGMWSSHHHPPSPCQELPLHCPASHSPASPPLPEMSLLIQGAPSNAHVHCAFQNVLLPPTPALLVGPSTVSGCPSGLIQPLQQPHSGRGPSSACPGLVGRKVRPQLRALKAFSLFRGDGSKQGRPGHELAPHHTPLRTLLCPVGKQATCRECGGFLGGWLFAGGDPPRPREKVSKSSDGCPLRCPGHGAWGRRHGGKK